MQRFILLLYCLIITLALNQSCSIVIQSQQIQCGIVKLQKGLSINQQYTHNLTLSNQEDINSSFTHSLSISSIENYQTSEGLDLQIVGEQKIKSKTIQIKLLIDKDAEWSEIVISYIVSYSDRLLAGQHITNGYLESNNEAAIQTIVTDFSTNSDSHEVKIFLSGLKTRNQQFELIIENASFDQKQLLQVSFIFYGQFQFIKFSYIIYEKPALILPIIAFSDVFDFTGLTQIEETSINTQSLSFCQEDSKSCEDNQTLEDGKCICSRKFYRNPEDDCVVVPQCPIMQFFDFQLSKCICIGGLLQSSEGKCLPIPPQCADGEILVDSQCIKCHINAIYQNFSCVCQQNFYGDGISCNQCHSTCSDCSGPLQNECLRCRDSAIELMDGLCSVEEGCPVGQYENLQGLCAFCGGFCRQCKNDIVCFKCYPGFQLRQQTIFGLQIAVCHSNCGNGIKSILEECDDNNLDNTDGCSSQCMIEEGYFCTISETRTSICSLRVQNRTYISVLRVANAGDILQQVQVTNIPEQFFEKDCEQCNNLLVVGVNGTNIKAKVQHQEGDIFFIRYSAGPGSLITNEFFYEIRLNPDFKEFFEEQDLNLVVQGIISLGQEIVDEN